MIPAALIHVLMGVATRDHTPRIRSRGADRSERVGTPRAAAGSDAGRTP